MEKGMAGHSFESLGEDNLMPETDNLFNRETPEDIKAAIPEIAKIEERGIWAENQIILSLKKFLTDSDPKNKPEGLSDKAYSAMMYQRESYLDSLNREKIKMEINWSDNETLAVGGSYLHNTADAFVSDELSDDFYRYAHYKQVQDGVVNKFKRGDLEGAKKLVDEVLESIPL